jgi:multiple sugar transport system permease protein
MREHPVPSRLIPQRRTSLSPIHLPWSVQRRSELALFLAPATLLFVGVVLYPLVYGLYLSLTETDPSTAQSTFVGFQNYGRLISDTVFWISLRVNLTYAVTTVVVELPLAFGVALLLNEQIRGRWLYRGLLLLPWVMPSIAAAVLWGWIFSNDYGLMNYYLQKLGLLHSAVGWLGNRDLALPATLIVQIWKGLPWTTVVLLAGLQTVPEELHEAAQMDGASAWQRLWHITVQYMRPVIVIILVLRFAWSFNTFDLVYILTSGGPGYSTYLLSIYMYLTSFSFREVGYGSTLATAMLLILLAISFVFIRTVSRKET